MLKRLLGAPVMLAALTSASADIRPSVVLCYVGELLDGTYVYSFDLQVTVTGNDAWTVAGGSDIGEPWITLTGGTFYQNAYNDANPPNPVFFDIPGCEDSQWTSFYTTHLGYPNTAHQGVSPSFAYGPADEPTALNADWFCTPDDNFYPGTFTIARFTVIPDDPDYWCVQIDMFVGSVESGFIPFTVSSFPAGCCPGDLDRDLDVDLADLAELLENYGVTGDATYWEGDLDGDDDVDLADLADLLTEYGTNCQWEP